MQNMSYVTLIQIGIRKIVGNPNFGLKRHNYLIKREVNSFQNFCTVFFFFNCETKTQMQYFYNESKKRLTTWGTCLIQVTSCTVFFCVGFLLPGRR